MLKGLSPNKRPQILATSVAALLSLGLMLNVPRARGDEYWDGTSTTGSGVAHGQGGSGNWDMSSTNTNWVDVNGNNPVAYDPTVLQPAIFDGVAGTVVLDNGNVSFKALQFNTSGYVITTGTNPYNLTPSITGSPSITVGSGVSVTIAAGLADGVGGSSAVDFEGAGTITLTNNGNTYSGGTTIGNGTTLVISGDGAMGGAATGLRMNGGTLQTTANVTDGRPISLSGTGGTFSPATTTTLELDGTISGSGGLTMSGSGTLLLKGTNSYQGGTVINSGTVQFSTDGNLGSTGSVTMNGGTLEATAPSMLSGRNFAISSGSIFLVDSGASLEITGTVSGGDLTLNGTGTLTLDGSGTNTYGNTFINAGTLQINDNDKLGNGTTVTLSNNGTLAALANVTTARSIVVNGTGATGGTIQANSGVTLDLQGVISGAGQLTLSGNSTNGIIQLDNAGNNYTGATNITAQATVQISAIGDLGNTSKITLNAGTLQATDNVTVTTAMNLGTGGGGLDANATKTLDIESVITGANTTLTIGSATSIGTVILGGANASTFNAPTTVVGGTLQITNDGNLGADTGQLTLQGGTLATTTSFSTPRTVNLSTGGGTFAPASTTTLTLTAATSGSGDLILNGAGTLDLDAVGNTYGKTTIEKGTLVAGVAGALPSNSAVTISTGGTLDITNTKQTVASIADGTGSVAPFGTITLGSGTLAFGNTTNTTFSGVIQDVAGGSPVGTGGNLTKTGSGTTTLAGANTYTGITTINGGGALDIGAENNLGAATNSLALANGTLEVSNSVEMHNRTITLGTGGGTLSPDKTVTLTVDGIVSGNTALTVAGAGTVVLTNGSNSYVGGTMLIGTLQISSDNDLGATSGGLTLTGGTLITTANMSTNRVITLGTPNSGFSDSFAPATGTTLNIKGGILDGTNSTAGLTMSGAGTLILSAPGNSYTGATTVASGTLQAGDANVISTQSAVVIASGATFDLQSHAQSIGSIADGTGGGGTIKLGTASLTVGNDNTNTTYSGTIQDGGSASPGSLTKVGTGTLTLAGANTYFGGTSITGGTVVISKDSNLGDASGTLALGTGGTLEISTGGAPTNSFATGRAITINSGGGTLVMDAGTTLTASGAITGGGALTVTGTLLGSGTLVLTNTNNTYQGLNITGGTNAPTVQVDSDGELGLAGSAISFDGGTLATTGNIINSRLVNLASNGGTFTPASSTTLELDGVIGGNGALTMAGTGTLKLGNTGNTYSGGTNITGGRVVISGDGSLGASTGNLTLAGGTLETTANVTDNRTVNLNTGGGTFVPDSGTTLALNGAIGGNGGLTMNGQGTLVLGNSANNYKGSTVISQGTLQAGAANVVPNGSALVIASSGTFNLNNFSQHVGSLADGTGGGGQVTLGSATLSTGGDGTSTSFSGVVSGSGGLTKTGARTQTLTGANTYTGNTTVNGGTLLINATTNPNVLSSSSTLVLGGGTFELLGTTGTTFQAVNGLTVNNGTNVVDVVNSGGTSTTLSLGAITQNTGGFVDFDTTGNAFIQTTTGNNSSGYIGTWATVDGGSAFAVNQGGNIVAYNGYTNIAATGTQIPNVPGGDFRITTDGTGGNNTLQNGFVGGTTDINTLTQADSNQASVLDTGGGTLRVGSEGGIFITPGGASLTIGTTPGSGFLTAGGADNTAGELVLANNNTSTSANVLTINSQITDNGTGVVSVAVGGSGVTIFNTTNSYSGTTTVSSGILQTGVADAISQKSAVLIGASGTLNLSNNNQDVGSIADGPGGGGTINLGTATLTTGYDDTNTAFSGTINGTGALTKTGTGTLTLAGVNTYSGGTNFNGGTIAISADDNLGATTASALNFNGGTLEGTTNVTLNANRTISLNGTGAGSGGAFSPDAGTALTIAGKITGSGNLTMDGAGTLIFTGTTNNYTGATDITSGTLQAGAANVFSTGSSMVIGPGGTLDLNSLNESVGSIADGTGGGGKILLGSGTLTTGSDGSNTSFSGVISGTGALNMAGAGTLILGGANTYSGGTTFTAGTIAVSSDGNLGAASGTLNFNGGTLETTTTFTSARAVTLTGSSGTFSPDTNTTLTLSGQITGSNGNLVMGGVGTLILTNTSNNYTGTTTINNGTLQAGAANVIPATSGVIINGNGIFDLNNFNQKVGSLSGGGNSTINLGSASLTISPVATSYAGQIVGTGSLIVTGTGSQTQTLTGTNTYSGGTFLNGGVLSIISDANLGAASSGVTFGGGVLQVTVPTKTSRNITFATGGGSLAPISGITFIIDGIVGGVGSYTQSGGGIVNLTNQGNNYAGATNINAGTLQAGAVNVIPSTSAVVIGTGATLSLNGFNQSVGSITSTDVSATINLGTANLTVGNDNTNTTFGGDNSAQPNPGGILGSGSLTKVGTGTLTLTGVNTYTGGTFINSGILDIAQDNSLGATSGTVTFNGGTLELTIPSGGASQTVSTNRTMVLNSAGGSFSPDSGDTLELDGQVTGSGALTMSGAGNLKLTDTLNSYTGGTNLNAGVIQITNDGQLGAASGVLTFNGGTLQPSGAFTSGRAMVLNSGGGTIAVQAQTDSATLSGQISGSGALTASGDGTLTLTNTGNNYSGGTNIGVNGSTPTVIISTDSELGSTSGALNFSGGILQTTAGFKSSRPVTFGTGGGTLEPAASTTLELDGTLSGTGVLTMSGPGTLVLTNGANSYSGGTILTGGTLVINADGNLGASTSNVNILNGILETTANVTSDRAFTLSGSTSSFSPAAGTVFEIDGTIGGQGGLTVNGAGTLLLTNTGNNYTLNTTILNGTLQTGAVNVIPSGSQVTINSTGTLALNGYSQKVSSITDGTGGGGTISLGSGTLTVGNGSGSPTTFSGVIIGTGGLTKSGTSILTLSGQNTYTGATTVIGGILQANLSATSTVFNSLSTLTVGGGSFQLNGVTGTTTTQVMNGLVVNTGFSNVSVNNVDPGVTTTLDLRGPSGTQGIARTSGGFVDFSTNAGGFILTGQANDAAGIIGSWATVDHGAAFATVNNQGQIVALDSTGYSDIKWGDDTIVSNTNSNVRINANTTGPGNPDVLGNGVGITDVNTLTQNFAHDSIIDTTGGTLRVGAAGGIFITPTGDALTIGTSPNAGTLTAGGNNTNGAGEMILENNSTSHLLTINSTITDNGTGSVALVVAGAGTTVLAGTNTYSGSTTIATGTLQAGAANTIPLNSAVTVDSTGTLDLQTFNQSVGSISDGLSGGGTITLGSATLVTGNDNTSTTFSGVIQDGTSFSGGSITKVGTGTLTLEGTNTYTGATNINGGTVVVSTEQNLGQIGFNGKFAALTFDGGGTLVTTGNIDDGRTITLNKTIGSGGGVVAPATGTTLEFDGTISGNGSLTMNGAGTLIVQVGNLNNPNSNGGVSNPGNTYSGGTFLKSGTLIVNGAVLDGSGNPLGTGPLTISGGTTLGTTIQTTDDTNGTTTAGTVITNPITLLGDFSVSSNGSSNFTLGGPITLGATRTITGTTASSQIHFGQIGLTSGETAGVNFNTTFTNPGDYVAFIMDPSNLNYYTGTTTINNGAFLVLEGTTPGGSIKGNVDIEGNGVLDYLSGAPNQINNANITVTVNSGGNDAGGTYFGGLDLYTSTGDTIGTLLGNGIISLGGGVLTLSGGNFSGYIFDGEHTGFSGGGITKTGSGTLILTASSIGADAYTGATTINGGTIQTNSAFVLSPSSQVVISSGATLDLNSFSQEVGSISDPSAGGGGKISLGSALLFNGIDNTSTSFSGIIQDGGVSGGTDGGIYKEGTGTLTLSGANTYTGVTYLHAGGLQTNAANTIPMMSTVFVDAGTTLNLNGFSQNVGSINDGASGTGSITLGAATLTVGNDNTTAFYSGNISDGGNGGNFVKQGTGTQILDGTNSYTGTTSVNGGSLVLGGSMVSPVTVDNGSEFDIFDGATLTTGSKVTTAVTLTANNTFLNSGSVTAAGAGTVGLMMSGGNNFSITQFTGSISAETGVTVNNATGINTVANFGTITGTGTNLPAGTFGVAVDARTSAGVTIGDYGTFNGSVLLGTGINTVVLNTNSPYVPIAGNGTDNTLRLAGGGLDSINPNAFVGYQSLQKVGGGMWTLAGTNTFTGGTTINGGILAIQGNLTSDTYVSTDGTLSGTGSLTGNIVNAGLFAPGTPTNFLLPNFSVGKFAVQGNYTQLPSGAMTIQIGGQGTSSTSISITGHAQLAGGLFIVPGAKTPSLSIGQKVTFLTAGGGVSGTFSSISNPFADNPVVSAEVVYTSNSVLIEGTQGTFSSLANTYSLKPNQLAVANAIDSALGNPKAAKLVTYLDGRPLSELPSDFDKISPEAVASVYRLGVSLADVDRSNVQRRTADIRAGTSGFSASGFQTNGSGPNNTGGLAGVNGPNGAMGKEVAPPVPDQRWGAFISGVGDFVHVGDSQDARGYDLDTGGFTLGADYKLTKNIAVGLSASYTGTTSDLNGAGHIKVNGGKVGVYGTYYTGGFYADVAANAGLNDYDVRRAALQGDASGSTSGSEIDGMVATGYDWRLDALTIGPTASFQYTRVNVDGYTEQGSLAPLRYGDQSEQSMRSSIGIKASYDWKLGGVVVRPEVDVAWQHEFDARSYNINSSLAAGSSDFSVADPLLGRDSLLFGAGVAVLWNTHASTYLYYDADLLQKDTYTQTVSGGLRWSF